MKRFFLFILIAALASAMNAQTKRAKKIAPVSTPATTEQPTEWPIETLTVEGNHGYAAQQILAVAQLRVGLKAGKPEFEAARARLVATGVFEMVGYRFEPAADGKGYDAVIEVSELGPMLAMRFEDLPVNDADLRAWLKQKDPLFEDKIPATKPELDRYTQWISEYLAAKEYSEPLAAKVSSDAPSGLIIVFRPAKQRPSVARVKFTNTGDVPAGLLQTAMYGVAIGTLFSEHDFRQLLDTSARPRYEAKGMLRVAFPKIETTPAKDIDGVEVTVQVEPGPVYKLGRVGFTGVSMSRSELTKLASLKDKQPVNFDDVKTAQERIAHELRRDGYLRASSEVKRDVNDTDHVVDLMFEIAPGPQFTLGKLDIVGLDIESEPVIRKMWGISPGKPFNPEYPDHFLKVVNDQGVFDNLKKTRAETKVNEKVHSVDVTLYFNK